MRQCPQQTDRQTEPLRPAARENIVAVKQRFARTSDESTRLPDSPSQIHRHAQSDRRQNGDRDGNNSSAAKHSSWTGRNRGYNIRSRQKLGILLFYHKLFVPHSLGIPSEFPRRNTFCKTRPNTPAAVAANRSSFRSIFRLVKGKITSKIAPSAVVRMSSIWKLIQMVVPRPGRN